MNKIKVYAASVHELKDETLFQQKYNSVSSERRRKIDGFLFQKDKMLSLAAELLLEKALQREGITHWQIRYGENGKPYMDGLFFNLSHSEERVMCAVSDREVGCDVEKVTDIELEIARRFFYGTEYQRIAAQTALEAQCDMFFRLWTLKESFMKATGLGMKLPLDAFRIDLPTEPRNCDVHPKKTSAENIICVQHQVNDKKYFFREYECEDGYRYAVCGLVPEFENMEFVSLR